LRLMAPLRASCTRISWSDRITLHSLPFCRLRVLPSIRLRIPPVTPSRCSSAMTMGASGTAGNRLLHKHSRSRRNSKEQLILQTGLALSSFLEHKRNVFTSLRIAAFSLFGTFLLFPGNAFAQVKINPGHFLGQQSCASSGCHGGGVGKDQRIIWQKKDVHSRAHAILGNAWSKRIVESLGIPDATVDVRCTVCHSPMESVPPVRLAAGVKPDKGVSCESCHGPAEKWLLFHTRTDTTHAQRVAAGLREVQDLYGRANACVACHLNIDVELTSAGHPELLFELDGQVQNQPPHYKDEGAWLGPKTWLTGQAAALRELSWKCGTAANDESLTARWEALIWLLRQTPEGSKQLPAIGNKLDFSTMQTAADRLARIASRSDWSKEKTMETLRRITSTSGEFRDELQSQAILQRRAQVLILAIDRLWQALKANGTAPNELLEKALEISAAEARGKGGFSAPRFSAALQQAEVALELSAK
ncbi:MAG: hypothetical protein EOP84_15090, partial [Verrucomicrobiaceae bacterium]